MQNEALPVRIEGPIKVEAEVKATMVGNNGKSAYEIAFSTWIRRNRGGVVGILKSEDA